MIFGIRKARLWRAAAAGLVCAIEPSGPAGAGESSATNFPTGVNTASSALYPPAGGTEFYNYDLFYGAGAYPTTADNPRLPPFHTVVLVEAFRVNHSWINLAPDITLGSGFALNFVYQSLDLPGGHRFSGGMQFADPDIIAYNLSFHVRPDLWIAQIFNIFPAWGQYSKHDIVNGGVGYTTCSPELAATWMTPKWEASLDSHVDFNTTNTQTSYHSGDDFDIDYNVGYRPLAALPALQVGLSGYYFTQVQNDTRFGEIVGDGNRGQVFAYGPLVRYDIGHGGLILKWQHETAVQNRTEGERIWFQFAVPL